MKRCQFLGLIFAFSVLCFSSSILSLPEIASEQEFNQLIVQEQLVVVDFYANWCGSCQRMTLVLAEIEKENPDIIFVKVNIDLLNHLAASFKIRRIPTLIFIKNGERVGRTMELMPKDVLQEKINSFFADPA